MEKQIFVLSSCDQWHTRDTYEPIGVFTSQAFAITNLTTYLKKSEEPLSKDDIDNLHRINQTQGRDVNYSIESFILNKVEE